MLRLELNTFIWNSTLSLGTRHFRLELDTFAWNSTLSSGTQHFRLELDTFAWNSTLSSGTRHFHLELDTFAWNSTLSSGTRHLHLELDTFAWNSTLSSGTRHFHLEPDTFTWNSTPSLGTQHFHLELDAFARPFGMATNSDDDPPHRQTPSSENKIRRFEKRRRIVGEEGQTQTPPRDKKKIRAGTNKRIKEVRASINSASIEWGGYNPDFLTFGLGGEKELHGFLQELEKYSTFARITADTIAKLLSELRKDSKLGIIARIQSGLSNLPKDDVILLTDAKSLKDALGQPFQVPLLHRVTASHPSLSPNTDFGFRDLSEHLAEDKEASISVYDYSIQDPVKRTRKTTLDEFTSCFRQGSACHEALNFLDIENRSGIQFCPPSIMLQNIITRLNALTQHDKGKTGSGWRAEPAKEFFLASKKNAISTIHIDSGGGVTWILILRGRKIWYFPRNVGPHAIRWLAWAGSQTPENYEGGWVKVELRRGDLLVMPPSFPHAVFTPDDCLAVGGQFYTAGNLGRSIEGLKLQEDFPDISNEDLDHSVYSTLARILNGCGPIITPSEMSQIVRNQSLFSNLSDPTTGDKHSREGLVSILKSLGVAIPPRATKRDLLELLKANSSTPVTPRREFLDALRKLCDRFMTDPRESVFSSAS